MRKLSTLVMAVVGLLIATADAAGINKCTVDGKTVYSDQPCAQGGTTLVPSQPPSPTPSKAGQEQETDTSKAAKDAKATQSEPKKFSLPVTLDGPVTIQKSERDGDTEADKSKHKASNEWWLVAWPFGLFLVTLALAGITGVLARYTYKLWRATSEASERQARESEASLAIAKRSADTARATVETMQANAQRQLRAYVSVSLRQEPSKFSDNRDHGLFTQIVPILHNSGETPTRQLVIAVECSWLNDSLAANRYFFAPDTMSFDQSILVQPRLSADCKPVEIQERQLLQHQDALYVWGVVRYRDIFLKHRYWRTEFCFRVHMSKDGDILSLRFEPYGIHNRADEECDEGRFVN